MIDDQRKILDMLGEGKISAADAERLLKAVSGRSKAAVPGAAGADVRERVEVRVEPPAEDGQPNEREDTFTVGESPRLVVDVDTGSLSVSPGPPGEIRVRAVTGGPSRVAYEASQDGDEVRVRARKKPRKLLFGFVDLGRGGRTAVEVTTPAATDVEAGLGAGPITLDGIGGVSSLHTAAGRISVEDASGTLEAAAVTGQVKVDGFQGSAKLSSTTGKIDVKQSSGEFKADVVTGAISFEGEMTPGGRNEMSAITGGIAVRLTGKPNLEIEASCVAGGVACELAGFVSSSETRGHAGRHLQGAVGAGEAALKVSTVTGSVKIEEAQGVEGANGP